MTCCRFLEKLLLRFLNLFHKHTTLTEREETITLTEAKMNRIREKLAQARRAIYNLKRDREIKKLKEDSDSSGV